MTKKASIIIRTYNEERWISSCLQGVFNQDYRNFEVILVDNQSSDNTVKKAKAFDVKVISIEEYLPGIAINLGVNNSTGDILICLSGHCIPTNKRWLSNLIRNLVDPNVAGVYGRQEPLSFSSDSDKRDLVVTFGLDRRIQEKDSFFHNANSAIPRSIWEKYPFDDSVTNIEDRIWAKHLIDAGYKIIYEPEASVYHYHGIHQDGDKNRLKNVVRILEEHDIVLTNNVRESYEISAIITVKGNVGKINDRSLLSYTIDSVKSSQYIHSCVVAADNKDVLDEAKSLGSTHCILRPLQLSENYVEIDDVLRFTLEELTNKDYFPDIILYLSVTNPFRPKGFLDNLIEVLVRYHYDTVIPSIKEYRSCWRQQGEEIKRIDEGFVPHHFKNPLHIGISGLGTAVFSDVVHRSGRLGDRVGIYELKDTICSIDVRDEYGKFVAETLLPNWWDRSRNEKE